MRKIASNKNYKLSKVAMRPGGLGPSPSDYGHGPGKTGTSPDRPHGLAGGMGGDPRTPRKPTPRDRQRAKQIADIEKKIEWHKKKIQRYEAQLDKL